MSDSYLGPIVLREFASSSDAYIAQGVLRANGINCELENDINSTIFGSLGAPYCSIRLLVNPADAQLAEDILSQAQD